MTGTPFGRREKSIPVTLLTHPSQPRDTVAGTALLRLDPAAHDHRGAECLVCSARGDVRALLFDLQERARHGLVPAFSAVTIDVSGIENPEKIIKDLTPGASPAFGLRDHAVARNFHLATVV